jgi:CNT family concentrative nucleoside transporter
VFVGMVEAPLFIRPYLAKVSQGELFAIMAGGMAACFSRMRSAASRTSAASGS